MLKKTIALFLTLCTMFMVFAPVAYAQPDPADDYIVETWDIDYYMNVTLVVKNEQGELFDAPVVPIQGNEFAISLLGPTVLQVPEGWTILTDPDFASGPGGTLTSQGGLSFGAGSEVTFIDTPRFREKNADPGQCAFMAWFIGKIAPPPTASNFSLAHNGFIFEKEGTEIARVVLYENIKKLYAPGQDIIIDITPAADLADFTLDLYLVNTYAGGDHPASVQLDGTELANGSRHTFNIDKNGVYTFVAELTGPDYSQTGTVDIGIIAPNEKPDDGFYYGLQAIMCRPFYWGAEYAIKGMDAKTSYDTVHEYLLYSGANLIRDGAPYNNISFENGINYGVLTTFIDDMSADGISINIGIGGTPDFAVDPAYTDGAPWQRPPQEDIFRAFMQDMASTFAGNPYILWEVYNEPNSIGFWTGGLEKYVRIVNIFSEELRAVNPEAFIVNGGMVVDREHATPEFYAEYAKMLESGVLTNVAIHGHGDIEGLLEGRRTIVPDYIPSTSIFLNESGNMTKTDLVHQAKHLAGKLIYSKANGYSGFVAFHLGAVDAAKNNMTPENNGGPLLYDYGMVSDELEPKPSYLAYMTVINMLNGAEPVADGGIIQESNNAFAYLFKRGDSYVEINIGEIREPALDLKYVEYDMFGNKGGSAREIVYRVYEAELPAAPVWVTYYGNGGTGSMADVEVPVGGSHILASSTFTRANYSFVGWNTSKNGSGQGYQPGDGIHNLSDNITLYAQWKADDSGGGSSGSGGGSSSENSNGSDSSSSNGSSSSGSGSSAGSYTRRTITDPNTGVSVTGHIAAGAKLEVKEQSLHASGTCDICDDIRARDKAGELIVLYDISISGDYQGDIEVSIPVGDEYNGQRLTVIHCLNKVLEEKTLIVQNGMVTGTFSALSPFGVLKPQAETPGSSSSNAPASCSDASASVPQTGDSGNIPLLWLWILAALLVMAACIGFLLWKRRQNGE